MPVWVAVLGALLLATPILIAFTLYISVMRMSNPEKLLRPVSAEQFPKEYDTAMGHQQWAEEEGFEFVGTYAFAALGTAFIAAWHQPSQRRFFCVYCVGQKTTRDFVSLFEGNAILTTGNAEDGLLLPCPPGSFMQVFVNTTVHEQWSKHLEAEEFLIRRAGLRIRLDSKPFAEAFIDGVKRQIAHVRSLPLWLLRGTYWYFIRRKKLKNRSVEQQFESGWPSTPTEV